MKVLKAIIKLLKAIWNWVVYSSKDPEKISLTLKGVIPFLVFLKVGDTMALTSGIDGIVHLIVLSGEWVSGAVAVYGALRKFYLSLRPSN